jgi:thioredoxin-related protein
LFECFSRHGFPDFLLPFMDWQQPAESIWAAVDRRSHEQAKGAIPIPMKIAIVMLASMLGACAFAASVGDSYDQVIAEKGKPTGQITAGNARVLNYADVSIRLRDDVVVEIRSIEAARGPVTRTDPAMVAKAVEKPEVVNASSGWNTSYRLAMVRARKEKRNVFLFFTVSDSSDACKRMEAEILATDEFKDYAEKKLVLLKLDYPKHAEQSDEIRSQNAILLEQYNVTEYPTVVILDPTGRPVKTLGYKEGGPKPFLAELRSVER